MIHILHRKKSLVFFFLLSSLSAFAQKNPLKKLNSSQIIHEEKIISFDVEIIVDTTAEITIKEKIKVNALSLNIQRGIFRKLPYKREINGRTMNVNYDIISITKDGVEEPYNTESEHNFKVIYIGDKDVMLEPGVYEYEIIYKSKKQIGYFTDFDEIYWNVTGTEWSFPIENVSATVILPTHAEILQQACYTGYYGDNTSNCSSEIINNYTIKFNAERLENYQGLTIAVGFPKNIIYQPAIPFFLQTKNLVVIYLITSIIVIAWLYRLWRKYGIDPKEPTAIPQFHIPQDMSPASMGYYLRQSYSHEIFTSSVINLAIKGYVKIIEDKKKFLLGLFNRTIFTISKIKNEDNSLPTEEIKLMKKLFSYSDSVTLGDKYNKKIKDTVQSYQNELKKKHAKISDGSNGKKLVLPLLLACSVYLIVISITYFYISDITLLVGNIIYMVVMLIVLGFYLLLKRRTALLTKIFWMIPGAITIISFFYLKNSTMKIDSFDCSFVYINFTLMIFFLFGYLIDKPSQAFVNTIAEIKGFKMYMTAAETTQIQHFNPPKLTPEIFEKLLPYAIVLNAEKVWGNKFSKLVEQSNQTTHTQSSWYVGPSNMGMSHAFSSNLAHNISSSLATSSTAPSSSGSGGGGSSGGGGGGGGGGGW